MTPFLRGGGKVLLSAPMAGFTDSLCRRIFREFGADAVVSEFVHARAVLANPSAVLKKLSPSPEERPVGVQIFGSDPAEMAEAAAKLEEELSPDFIDINFGCPAAAVTGSGAGAALLKNPKLMGRIAASVSRALKRTPCTAKLRTGWSSSDMVLPGAALLLEDSGVGMLCVHGRTAAQGYSGDCNWNIIEKCALALKIPLVGNGSAEKLDGGKLRNSPCAGFMVGRAALGNPWIFERLRLRLAGGDEASSFPSPSERISLALRYAELACSADFKDSGGNKLTYIKTRLMPYLKGFPGFKKLRISVLGISTLDELKELLCRYL